MQGRIDATMVDEGSSPNKQTLKETPALAAGRAGSRIEVEGIAVYTDCSRPRSVENLSDGEDLNLEDELVFSIPPLSAKKGSLIPTRSDAGPTDLIGQLISFDDIASLANSGRFSEDGGYVPTASLPFAARLAVGDGKPSGLRLRGRRGSGGNGGWGGTSTASEASVRRAVSAPRPSRTYGEVHSDLRPGQRVRVHGLQKNPEMNGRTGKFTHWHEDDPGWCIVHFDSGEGNQLRAANLIALDEDVAWAGFHEFTSIGIPAPRGDSAPRPPANDDFLPRSVPQRVPQVPQPQPQPLPSACSFDDPSLQAGLTVSLPLAASPRVSHASSFMDRDPVPNERGGSTLPLPHSAITSTALRTTAATFRPVATPSTTATAFRPKASVCHALDERALDDECHDDKEWFARRPPRCGMMAKWCGGPGCPSSNGAAGRSCDEMPAGVVWPPCAPMEQLRVRVRL